MYTLVAGGLGYIGSHTCVELLNNGIEIVIVDNLSNSNVSVIEKIELLSNKKVSYVIADCTNLGEMGKIFKKFDINKIINFAGYKAVGESVEKPLMYYMNNLNATMVLAQLAIDYNVEKYIFSSSATVYGEDNVSPLNEDMKLSKTTNPYGETKSMGERILEDVCKANPNFSVTILRYFNPVGAHPSGLIGEKPNGIPNNLMPYISMVATKQLPVLSVFGDDYDTKDGTGVRDYIHVSDLAIGHLLAIKDDRKGLNVYNLGVGKGLSVLELVNTFSKINKIDVPYVIKDRRAGDLDSVYASSLKAYNELGWTAVKTVEDMCKDTWTFEQNFIKGNLNE